MQERSYKISERFIGQGSYSKIYYAYYTDSSKLVQRVACKIMEINNETQQRLVDGEKILIDLCLRSQSPNLVTVHDFKIEVNKFYIFMEICDFNLKQIMTKIKSINRQGNNILPSGFYPYEVDYIMKEILNGYKPLVQLNVIHRDIKPENILIKNNRVKLADFGFAKYVPVETQYEQPINQTARCTTLYGCPQIIMSQDLHTEYSAKCDIWSLGIILYELVYGKTPYPNNITNRFSLQKYFIENRNFVKPEINGIPRDYWNVISKMLEYQEENRYSWNELIEYQDQLFFEVGTINFIDFTDYDNIQEIVNCNEFVNDEFYFQQKNNGVGQIYIMKRNFKMNNFNQ